MTPTRPPRRLRPLVGVVCAAGLATVVAAGVSFAGGAHDATTLASLAGLLLACSLAERFPVPLDGTETGGVSLSFVFVLSALLLFGWSAGVLVGFTAVAVMHLIEHRPPIRIAYNSAVFALAAAAAGWSMRPLGGDGAGSLAARVAVSTFVDHWVNLLLIAAVVAVSRGKAFLPVLRANLRGTTLPFALMASAALMLVVLWERSPALSIALVGPLLAMALYQRSTHEALRATRLALTDPLTGLGNHRAFHERLRRELLRGEGDGLPLALCLLDVDDFKAINDRHGHPAGDDLLARVADHLRGHGEAFRLGGDEFALLLPEHDEADALRAAEAIIARLGALDLGTAGRATLSAGLATFPAHGGSGADLIRLADTALYRAKESGKGRALAHRPPAGRREAPAAEDVAGLEPALAS